MTWIFPDVFVDSRIESTQLYHEWCVVFLHLSLIDFWKREHALLFADRRKNSLFVLTKEVVDFLLVIRALWVVYSEYLHVIVSWVGELWARNAYLMEIRGALLCFSLVHDMPITHENKSVK